MLSHLNPLLELWTRKEDLIPELQLHLADGPLGSAIEHPLLKEVLYSPSMNAYYNALFQHKKASCEKHLTEQKYHSFIFMHERPYRLQAFLEVAHLLTSREYWETLGEIWADSENIWQNITTWKRLLTSSKPNKEYFMKEDEREHLAILPNHLTVYRGYDKSPNGLSYSLSKTKATWFASRFNKKGKVRIKRITKDKVFAYLNGRNEQEVIIL